MKLRITIGLILVIALQSLVGVIDANQPHHPAVVHEAHDHEFHSDPGDSDRAEDRTTSTTEVAITVAETAGSSLQHMMDHATEHCHFNHVHFHIVPMSVATHAAIMGATQRFTDVASGRPSATPRSPFRPPIV